MNRRFTIPYHLTYGSSTYHYATRYAYAKSASARAAARRLYAHPLRQRARDARVFIMLHMMTLRFHYALWLSSHSFFADCRHVMSITHGIVCHMLLLMPAVLCRRCR